MGKPWFEAMERKILGKLQKFNFGVVNKKKAAREILKDTEISSCIRFCIACYCSFFYVPSALWWELPEHKKPDIVIGEMCTDGLGKGGNDVMDILWSCFLLGKHFKRDSFLYYKFMKFFENEEKYRICNDVSIKNCFEELYELLRKEAVIFSRSKFKKIFRPRINRFSCNEFLQFLPQMEMVIYMLRHLDENQVKIFFQEHGILYLVLYSLLSWPCQQLFMGIVNRFWELLPKSGFYFLLCNIACLMNEKFSGKYYDLRYLFKEFWIQSPSSLKAFFFRVESGCISTDAEEYKEFNCFHREFRMGCYVTFECFVIHILFNSSSFTIEDEEIIRLIFASATMEQKLCIVESKWLKIGKLAFKICDMKRIDLFIECCVPNERVTSFKRKLFNDEDNMSSLWNFFLCGKSLQLRKILSWGLNGEEIEEYQQGLLHSFLTSRVRNYSSDEFKFSFWKRFFLRMKLKRLRKAWL